jgi:hypothetical protein
MNTEGHIWFREAAEPSYQQVGEILRAMADLKRVYVDTLSKDDCCDDMPPALRAVLQKLVDAE